jgi:hypothetical protein
VGCELLRVRRAAARKHGGRLVQRGRRSAARATRRTLFGRRRSGGALKQLAFQVALRIHCGGALCCELLLVRALRDVERRRGFRGERCLLRRELLRVRRVETRELGRRVVKSARVRL